MQSFFKTFAFVTEDPLRLGGVTLFTSAFLHGGWLHLIGNAFFLWVFGDDVENYLGTKRFLALYLFAALGGNLLYLFLTPASATPAIGASGAVFGIMAYYILRFPQSQFYYAIFLYVRIYWFTIPAALMFGFKIIMEIVLSKFQGVGGGVNHLAHVGGAIVGGLFFMLFPKPEGKN